MQTVVAVFIIKLINTKISTLHEMFCHHVTYASSVKLLFPEVLSDLEDVLFFLIIDQGQKLPVNIR